MNKKKTQVSVLFMLFSILFCVCLIAANVLETKQIAFGPVSLTGGLIVFPVSYIINDVVCEDRKKSCNFAAVFAPMDSSHTCNY